MAEENLVYFLDGKIYINLTNRCTNNCIFCLRKTKDNVCGQKMWLSSEDYPINEVTEQLDELLKEHKGINDVVFCGYGEPTLKLEILKKVAQYTRNNYPSVKTRINTNGHANYVYKRNIIPELKGLIDEISVSLNAENDREYDRLSKPNFKGAFDEVKKFIKASSDGGIETVASIVEGYKGEHHDIELCKKIAKDCGAKLRVREWIPVGYD